jgi:hypothetical protein
LAGDPALTSIINEIATDTKAYNAFTSLEAIPAGTDTKALATFSSLLALLPPDAQSFFSSVGEAEISVLSSIVNEGGPTETGNAFVPSASATCYYYPNPFRCKQQLTIYSFRILVCCYG